MRLLTASISVLIVLAMTLVALVHSVAFDDEMAIHLRTGWPCDSIYIGAFECHSADGVRPVGFYVEQFNKRADCRKDYFDWERFEWFSSTFDEATGKWSHGT